MKNSELRKVAMQTMRGKLKKASLYVVLYTFILSLLITTPAGPILATPLGFGIIKSIIAIKNGENIKAFNFFSFGINNFSIAWSTYLLVILRALVPMLLGISSLYLCGMSGNEIINNILFVIAEISTIVVCCIFLKYSLVNYEILYNPEVKAKEIMNKHEKIIKGNAWKIIRMNLYYNIIKLIPSFGGVILGANFVKKAWGWFDSEYMKAFVGIWVIALVMIAIVFLIMLIYVITSIFIEPRKIVSNNELYNYLVYKYNKKQNEQVDCIERNDELNC